MQIELSAILNKAWAGLILLIPWAKRTLDKRFEATEKKVTMMSKQMSEIATKQDIHSVKLDHTVENINDLKESVDKLHDLLIEQIKTK